MPTTKFFARLQPEFAQQAGSVQEAAERQVQVERLISTAEYECYQVRRELVAVMTGIGVPLREAGAAAADAVTTITPAAVNAPAKAA